MTATLALEQQGRNRLGDSALDQLFRKARTQNGWKPGSIQTETVTELYDLVKMGPTSANGSPARFVFLVSDEAKERLLPTLMEMNKEKARTASAVVLIAYDTEFFEQLPRLAPQADFRSYFAGNPELAEETAFRNSSLQGAYLILAARALGLDVGAMSGFDPSALNQEFFPDGKNKINFIVTLGYGDESKVFSRNPRLEFVEAATIL